MRSKTKKLDQQLEIDLNPQEMFDLLVRCESATVRRATRLPYIRERWETVGTTGKGEEFPGGAGQNQVRGELKEGKVAVGYETSRRENMSSPRSLGIMSTRIW